jgi:hypothetical protein
LRPKEVLAVSQSRPQRGRPWRVTTPPDGDHSRGVFATWSLHGTSGATLTYTLTSSTRQLGPRLMMPVTVVAEGVARTGPPESPVHVFHVAPGAGWARSSCHCGRGGTAEIALGAYTALRIGEPESHFRAPAGGHATVGVPSPAECRARGRHG